MKYQPLFSIILMFVFSACTAVVDVKPATPTQIVSYPITGKATPDSAEKGDDSGAAPSIVPTILSEKIVTMPVSSNLEKLIDTAKEDLARRLDIKPDEIKVLHIEKAEWPDTSLVCAKPGLARYPVAIPGYRIIFSAREREYVYHTNNGSGVVYCPKG